MFPTIRPSAGGASANTPPAAADDAVPGPSGANANPDGFDASRARVARVLAQGRQRGNRPKISIKQLAEEAQKSLASDTPEVREALRRLQEVCQNKNIKFCGSLYRLLTACPQASRALFIKKIALFFEQAVGVKSTQTITTMLGPPLYPKYREPFLAMDDADITSVAQCGHIQHVATMHNDIGFPTAGNVKDFLATKSLNPGGQFDHESFRSIVIMCSGKGIPSSQAVDALLAMPIFKTDGVFNHTLFKSITSFYCSKGFPDSQDVQDFLNIDALKINGQISQQRINILTTMCRGKGLPARQAVTDLFSSRHLLCDGELSYELLAPVTGIFSSKGIPTAAQLQTLLTQPLLQRDNKICLPLLKSISSMQNRKGLPDLGKMKDLLSITELMTAGGGARAFPILSSVASMCNNRGLPDKKAVLDLLGVRELRTANGEIDQQILKTLAFMQHSKGLANAKVVHELLSLPELQVDGQVNTLLLRAIGNLYACKGVPTATEVQRLLALPGLYVDGHFNHQLLAEVATKGIGKGFPTNEIINNARAKLQHAHTEPEDDADPHAEDDFELPGDFHPLSSATIFDQEAWGSFLTDQPMTSAAVDGASSSAGDQVPELDSELWRSFTASEQSDPASSVDSQSAAPQPMATDSVDEPSGGDDQDEQPLPPTPADDDFELPDLDPYAFLDSPNMEALDSFLHNTPMTSAAADGASSSAGDQLPAFDSEFWQPFTASEPTPSTSGTSRRSAPEPSSPSLVGKRTTPLAKRRKKE